MICPKCNLTISDNAIFCSRCGEKLAEKTEESIKFCLSCGEAIKEGNKFCAKCGTSVGSVMQTNVSSSYNGNNSTSGKSKGSYFVSVISAIISFIIRLIAQDTFYSWSNLLDNRKVVGIDSDIKPFLTAIPIIAAIIVSLLIVSDKNTPSQKKATTFIVNAIFIALSVLFIWFDIPYAIFDF